MKQWSERKTLLMNGSRGNHHRSCLALLVWQQGGPDLHLYSKPNSMYYYRVVYSPSIVWHCMQLLQGENGRSSSQPASQLNRLFNSSSLSPFLKGSTRAVRTAWLSISSELLHINKPALICLYRLRVCRLKGTDGNHRTCWLSCTSD